MMQRRDNDRTGRGERATSVRRLIGIFAAIIAALILAPALQAQEAQLDVRSTSFRYDGAGRLVGEISPDPDGAGPLHFPAKRTIYDQAGLVVRVETGELLAWQPTSVDPNNWPNFTILLTEKYSHDTMGRVVRAEVVGSDNVTASLVQTNYDHDGRPGCTAVRMDTTKFATAPSSACTLTSGASDTDRIEKKIYDADGRLRQIRKAFGTAIENAEVTYDYTNNGQLKTVIDANGNCAEMRYDGHDRLVRWVFPSKTRRTYNAPAYTSATCPAGTLAEGDYEAYTYDNNGNRLTLRKRDNTTITYYYDALNQLYRKDIPNRTGLDTSHSRDVYYTYDLRGLQLSARFGQNVSDPGIVNTFTGFGELETTTSTLISGSPNLEYEYDADGNRTRITHPDNQAFDMTFDLLDRLKEIKKGSAVLVAPSFTNRGTVGTIARNGSAHTQSFGYDAVGRMDDFALSATGSSSNVAWSFLRNPASQIRQESRTNDAYAWLGRVDVDRDYTTNGLNQYTETQAGSAVVPYCYDENGNLIADDQDVYLYDVENRLVERRARTLSTCPDYLTGYSGTLKATLHYDPLGRLYEVVDGTNGNITRFLNDGDALVLEYSGSNAILRRYIHGSGAGADDPLIWYEGSGTANANLRNLYADPRGSIVLVAGQSGNTIGINTYDEWGNNLETNQGRFQFTGQAWLEELGAYYYKARIYSSTLGRFMQTDPIGYDGGNNLYAYVGNDPVNLDDFSGKQNRTRRAVTGPEAEPSVSSRLNAARIEIVVRQIRRIDPEYRAPTRIARPGVVSFEDVRLVERDLEARVTLGYGGDPVRSNVNHSIMLNILGRAVSSGITSNGNELTYQYQARGNARADFLRIVGDRYETKANGTLVSNPIELGGGRTAVFNVHRGTFEGRTGMVLEGTISPDPNTFPAGGYTTRFKIEY